jgi:integrase
MTRSSPSRTTTTTQTPRSAPCPSSGLKIIQQQVGHRCDTSTAIYTHVSGDFMNTALRKALGPAMDVPGGQQ